MIDRTAHLRRLSEQKDTDALWKAHCNELRRERRKQLYHSDPIWRLTKLKDNRERKLRAKLGEI